MAYQNYIFNISEDFDTWSDILVAELAEYDFDSFDTNEGVLNAYLPQPSDFNLTDFKSAIAYVPWDLIKVEIKDVEEQNWNAVWESNFDPIYVGDLIVKAPFHEVEAKEQIIIQPKMSFGTGHHQTTFLILSMMQEMNWQDLKVLDMGAGTAVLGIYAALKGAQDILAVDIDVWCYDNAIENASLNGVSNMKVLQGGVETLAEVEKDHFDVVLANINRNILTRDMHEYIRTLKTNGHIIFSGFYTSDLPHIEYKANEYGLKLVSHQVKEDWVAAKFIKA